jgi:hypothetical protein
MAGFVMVKSGEDCYKGRQRCAKRIGDGMKVGKQEFKATLAKEN